jgi:hypothetical protein
MLMLG